jgi:hypothetical protein
MSQLDETVHDPIPGPRAWQALVFQRGTFRHAFLLPHLLGMSYRPVKEPDAPAAAIDSRIDFYFSTMTVEVSGQRLWGLYCLLVFGVTPEEPFKIVRIGGDSPVPLC